MREPSEARMIRCLASIGRWEGWWHSDGGLVNPASSAQDYRGISGRGSRNEIMSPEVAITRSVMQTITDRRGSMARPAESLISIGRNIDTRRASFLFPADVDSW